jgi:hypothetical protein
MGWRKTLLRILKRALENFRAVVAALNKTTA